MQELHIVKWADTGSRTCMCNASSGCSPIIPSVIMTRFPASLDVWEDREEEECRIDPCRFRGLQDKDNVVNHSVIQISESPSLEKELLQDLWGSVEEFCSCSI